MIEYSELPGTNIIEITIDGKIGKADFDETIARMDAAIDRHGWLRVLEHVRSFDGFPVSRIWADLRFGFEHLEDVSHVAVVADQKWIERLSRLVIPFIPAEFRHFDSSQIDKARDWLRSAG